MGPLPRDDEIIAAAELLLGMRSTRNKSDGGDNIMPMPAPARRHAVAHLSTSVIERVAWNCSTIIQRILSVQVG
eukprot:SAG22_NODE_9536_length_584_cov_1.191753_1_plen_74_part_00